jgi:IS5 family transposase
MELIVPWSSLCAVIEPHYPKAGNGRPPIGLQRMLRIHFIQHWFNLADLACEEALYDSASLRRFVGIDLGCEPVPDSTTESNNVTTALYLKETVDAVLMGTESND